MKTVLFVCVHNAGRSQMAEALLRHEAARRGLPIQSLSAGTEGGKEVNPLAVEALREIGVSMDGQVPKLLTQELADRADKIISMGCGVDATTCPARFLITEDWGLDDPKGQSLATVRRIRDEIRDRTLSLLSEFEQFC